MCYEPGMWDTSVNKHYLLSCIHPLWVYILLGDTAVNNKHKKAVVQCDGRL